VIDIREVLINKCKVMQGDRIAVGLSGGADSVCLLLLLCGAREELGLDICAVHVHHGLRGAEADEDLSFAKELAERLGVEFESVRIDAREIARSKGVSVEEAGRGARYEALRRRAAGGLVAVGHHLDDQAETILMNIVRGSGLAGAAGMDWRSGDIIRPLLSVPRTEIEEWLRERGQSWRTDSTNLSDDYTRNRIRHSVMPVLADINSRAAAHICAFGDDCREALEIEEKLAEELFQTAQIGKERIAFDAGALRGAQKAAACRAIQKAIAMLAGSSRDIGRIHLEQTAALAALDAAGGVDLPCGLRAEREYGLVVISSGGYFAGRTGESDRLIARLNKELSGARVFSAEGTPDIPKKEYTKWFDYDKIESTLVWRTRREGDTIALAGVGEKSAARFMLDLKIPAGERGFLPLLADGSQIVWVPGYRISEAYKVTSGTKRIIEINIEGVYGK